MCGKKKELMGSTVINAGGCFQWLCETLELIPNTKGGRKAGKD